MSIPVVLSWSGGKDSTMALHALRANPQFEVVALLTTVSEEFDRVVMQGVRRDLVEQQALALGIPLDIVALPSNPSNQVYEARLAEAFSRWHQRGVTHVAFGDLFLEDIREFRIGQLQRAGMTPVFPVWTTRAGTTAFMEELLRLGYRAYVACVDPGLLPAFAAGREVDRDFLDDLPAGVDPAGENGEFHTFVFDGPGFSSPVEVALGESVVRNGFLYRDLVPRS